MNSWSSVPVDLGQLGLSRVINWVRFSSSWVRSGRVNLCNFNFSRVGVIQPGLMHVPYTDIPMFSNVWHINANWCLVCNQRCHLAGQPIQLSVFIDEVVLAPPTKYNKRQHTHTHTSSHNLVSLSVWLLPRWATFGAAAAAMRPKSGQNDQIAKWIWLHLFALRFCCLLGIRQASRQTNRQTGRRTDGRSCRYNNNYK